MQVKTEQIKRYQIEEVVCDGKEYAIEIIEHGPMGIEYDVFEKSYSDDGDAENGPDINIEWKSVAKGSMHFVEIPTDDKESVNLLKILLQDFAMIREQDLAIRTLVDVEKFLTDEEKFNDVIDHEKDCWDNPGCILCQVQAALKELRGE